VKTAQQAAANWVGSAGRAATGYQQGVEGYNGDWAGATTRQQNAMSTNWNQSVANGTWANGVNRVGTNGWKQATVARISNYSTGFQAGASKQAAAIAKIIQAEQNILGSLPPRGDYNANKVRAGAFMDQMHALKGSLGAA
jgi:hypothetical protein